MTLLPEQVIEIKKQIIAQVDSSQMENKEEIKKSIQEMNPEELENFLKANNIPISGVDGSEPASKEEPKGECVFCSIINGKVPSHKLEENAKAIAILELNPASEGHSIILPKEHVTIDKLPKSAMSLAQKIAKRIKSKLKANDIKIETSNFQGHTMINLIPIYEGKDLEKKKATEEELTKLQKKLEIRKRASRKPAQKKEEIKETKKLPIVKFRIP